MYQILTLRWSFTSFIIPTAMWAKFFIWLQRKCLCHKLSPGGTLFYVSTEFLKWCPRLWQMWDSTLCQTLHVCILSDTQKIQSSDWPKLPNFLPFVNLMSFWTVLEICCWYVNWKTVIFSTKTDGSRLRWVYTYTSIIFQVMYRAVFRSGPKNLLRPNMMKRLHLFPDEVREALSRF